MARKYLQMRFTRARHYADYKAGKKYDKEHDYQPLERGTGATEKSEAAKIVHDRWKINETDDRYAVLKKQCKDEWGLEN